jgi:hypothetical protein
MAGALLAATAMGCASAAAQGTTVCYAFQDLSTGFWVAGHGAIVETLQANGVEVVELNGGHDANRQLEQVRDCIAQGGDGIILRLVAFSSSRLARAWLVAGNAVGLRLVVRFNLWRLLFTILLLFVFSLIAGVDHLGRVLAILRVQPEPLRRLLGTILSQLGNKDAGVGVLGDHRRPLDKITLHRYQFLLGLLSKRGQLG